MASLQFIFTSDSFYPDGKPENLSAGDRKRFEQFERDRYAALYQMGLAEKPEELSPSAAFLHLLADTWFRMLTDLPELELAREKAEVSLSEEAFEKLEQAVPFAIGAEYITREWIVGICRKLAEIFAGEITLMEALRMELGTGKKQADTGPLVTNGRWLASLLQNLRRPEAIGKTAVPRTLQATLRPYQGNGYTWLHYMDKLGFGACLADDMGLGKTVQVLAYLEKLRLTKKDARALLVVPASLIGNWEKEARKFTPKLDLEILHGKTSKVLEQQLEESSAFLTVTTYGMASRIQALQNREWDCIILDEAQAIKNPVTKQTKEIKKLSARMRIAMTGTPIENDLTNLWSLFDFLNKGLMGTSSEFHEFCKRLNENPQGYARLKTMVSPFMLRRVKTDKSIIADLPEKLETVDYTELAKKQVVLYRKVVADLEKKLEEADGIERRGMVLAAIMKLKQICNHPDQYMGQQTYAPGDSGKFTALREICSTIYEKRERVLVFTQFKEITEYLAAFLKEIFGTEGYVLHGGTPVAKRSKIVEAFQGEKYVPFIVLSVKAGGTGLNLTKANHVIHFDRGRDGLFPTPKEISFSCSCPDWALMCKHVAAALYGVGARLDEQPLLFFELRGIDVGRFIDVTLANKVEAMLANAKKPSERIIGDEDVSRLFGVL